MLKPPQTDDARLRRLLTAYLDHDSFPLAGQQLNEHPELTGDACDRLLLSDLLKAIGRRDSAETTRLRQHRAFLKRCGRHNLADLFPAASDDIDPVVAADIQIAMTRADATEARYDEGGDATALRDAAAMWRRIAEYPSLREAYPALRAVVWNNAGGVLLRCVWSAGDIADLNVAVTMLRNSVALTPPSSPRSAGRLGNLGLALREAYRCSSEERLLVEAIETLRRAVDAAGDPPAVAAALSNLALGLEEAYISDGDSAHLDEAVTGCELALRLPVGAGVRFDLLVQLGNGLRQRFEARAGVQDLGRAVDILEQVRDETPAGSPQRPRRLVDLGIALLDRHAQLGDPADLAEALRVGDEAVRIVGAARPDRPGCLVHLGLSHLRRFDVDGTLDDLDRAVALLDEALSATPDGSVDWPARAANLGVSLRERARQRGSLTDLNRAIEMFTTAADFTSQLSPRRPVYINNVGNTLRDRYASTLALDDLEASIAALKLALNESPDRAEYRPTVMTNVAAALRDWHRACCSPADLDRAVRLLRAAGAGNATGQTDRSRRLVVLALVLADRFDMSGDERDRSDALHAFETGCAAGLDVDPESALDAANQWGSWAAAHGWWAQAAAGYAYAITALVTTVRIQLVREDKESWLRRGVSVSSQAALAIGRAGHARDAVRALEVGRAMLLAESLELGRVDLRELGRARSDLAVRYLACVQRVRALERRALLDSPVTITIGHR